ncbi:TIGR03667 family PPOX class F420-dependent oxidoreductase [Streptomyces sp. SID4919]|uniref:Pyridoxamine 5'-phosphate oxidase N-terminal domain-containing protein n=1 Tax=Streptomyces uncialis TaxID=1048205 RepID=A0A1Q4V427_9ACTN|nr:MULTISPECIES: pyridoxamine 5'-phosphate oxidase family protein [Streptomyces]MYY12834.1 TIGR03667 family PPOX class F420-dependent oxidoreductase [Streptomyces sp. SID4919]OKH92602.1 hypothetical protein AB852_23450 [Streptomyces uncialis]WTE09990.1 pyridoxamine 5'-phosphate oxidase family protein [Streptomyces uncialis]SCK61712.1 PPOX class probable F420-dependent enzyme, Rv3369 family [Streptomyces sp. AmelKG-E11A]
MTRPLERVLPDASGEYGARVRRRLARERVVWLSTVSDEGFPEPNPVWFHWDEDDGFTVYNDTGSRRVRNIRARPEVTLHFDGGEFGRDIVVFRGRAEVLVGVPPTLPGFLAKYGDDIDRIMGGPSAFRVGHPAVVRVRPVGVRGR